MIGQTLNWRYKITSFLGQGGMGEVYRATDKKTRYQVAVKILTGQLSEHPEVLERFRRETETLRKLDHPNIVKFVDSFEYKRRYIIVMEYVSGGSLYQLLKHGPLPFESVRRIALELCDALIRSHYLNIIHRDIKPENVMMDKDGTPKLADFGVARLSQFTRMTRSGTQVGTPYYMAPEAWEGKPLDAQADIWSLGVLLFEMLAGQVPFDGDTPLVVMNKVHTTTPPDLGTLRAEVPAELAKIVNRMLMREKDMRYQSMREVAFELERGQNKQAELEAAEKVESEEAELIPKQGDERVRIEIVEEARKQAEPGSPSPETVPSSVRLDHTAPAFSKAHEHFRQIFEKSKKMTRRTIYVGISYFLILSVLAVGTVVASSSLSIFKSTSTPTLHSMEIDSTPSIQVISTKTPFLPATGSPIIVIVSPSLSTPVAILIGLVTEDNVNIRSGPGLVYPGFRKLHSGAEIVILGRSEDEGWLLVELADDRQGWISSNFVSFSSTTAGLVIATAPPTPIITYVPVPTRRGGGDRDPCEDFNRTLDQLQAIYGSMSGDPNFDPGVDFNGDGTINVIDIGILTDNAPPGCT